MSNEWTYGVSVREEDGYFVARSEELPEAIAGGDTKDAALREMREALAAAVRGRIKDGDDLDAPRPVADGADRASLPSRTAAKAAVYQAWKRSGLSKSALGKAMNRDEVEVRRILDPDHGTKLDQMEAAAQALGGRLVVSFVPA